MRMPSWSSLLAAVLISAAGSFGVVSVADDVAVGPLVGGDGPEDCSDCTLAPFVFHRCVTAGAFDPCSTISCMTITLHCAQCDPTPSVDECHTEPNRDPFSGVPGASGTESTTDVECSADTPNSPDPVDLDTDDCTGTCSAVAPCQTDGCGSGSQYGWRVLRIPNDKCQS